MNQYISLLPRMALSNIHKNKPLYFPYIGVSVFAVFTYFVFDLILKNDIMYTLPKGAYALILVQIGFVLLGLIMIPFLYYTNSFLIKRRKKELGLYSILGLEKKHIGIMMFWESVVVYAAVTAAAIVLGLIFSRLIFLLLLNLARLPVNVEFSVSLAAIADALVFYAFITVLNLFVNLVQVGRSNPVELMSDAKRGEKEPKRIGLWGMAGLLALVAGYSMALKAKLETQIFIDFFLAVFLVVIGTYLLFTSGSIAFLKFLKRRKKYYYRPENFITVSGMLYRMKKSAAGLSNICIFSTMVIITVVCTVVIYLDMETIVSSNFYRKIEVYFYGDGQVDSEGLRERAEALAAGFEVELEDELAYSYVLARAYQKDDVFCVEGEPYGYSGWTKLLFMTLEEYNLLEGVQESLAPGEVLLFASGPDFGKESLCLEGTQYKIKKELQESSTRRKLPDNSFDRDYIIVFADREQLDGASRIYGVDGFHGRSYFYGVNLSGGEENMDAFSAELAQYAEGFAEFAEYKDHREKMKDQESMYGGLLFIGIFFGSIFLICLLVIMYYKQVTEGFEDQLNFEIMQKVGMDEKEIRRTVKKQICMVFGLPLAGALLHTAVGMKMVYMLLGSIGFFEADLLAACAAGGCIVFAAVYGLSYKRTSTAYYRIVKSMN